VTRAASSCDRRWFSCSRRCSCSQAPAAKHRQSANDPLGHRASKHGAAGRLTRTRRSASMACVSCCHSDSHVVASRSALARTCACSKMACSGVGGTRRASQDCG
jgi:hypothetical protein